MSTPNPVRESINRHADDPSVSVHVPLPLAECLVQLVGGARSTGSEPGRWSMPDGAWFWELDEALRYALEVMPDLLGDLYAEEAESA